MIAKAIDGVIDYTNIVKIDKYVKSIIPEGEYMDLTHESVVVFVPKKMKTLFMKSMVNYITAFIQIAVKNASNYLIKKGTSK